MATYINAQGELVDENGQPTNYNVIDQQRSHPSYEEYLASGATKPGAEDPASSGLIDIKIPDYTQQYATDAASNEAWHARNAQQQDKVMGRQMYGRNAEEKRDAFAKMNQQSFAHDQYDRTNFVNPYPQYVTQGAVFKPGADGTNPFAPAPASAPPPVNPYPTGAPNAPATFTPGYNPYNPSDTSGYMDAFYDPAAQQSQPATNTTYTAANPSPDFKAGYNPYNPSDTSGYMDAFFYGGNYPTAGLLGNTNTDTGLLGTGSTNPNFKPGFNPYKPSDTSGYMDAFFSAPGSAYK